MTFQKHALRLAAILTASVAAVAIVACASATAARSAGSAPSRRMLLGDEIRARPATDAYEAVSRLRPEWLRRRGQISIRDRRAGEAVVYLDGQRYGGPRSLESIRIEMVLVMEYLDASDATTRFGSGHAGGAILVRTR